MAYGNSVHNRNPGAPCAREIWLRSKDPCTRPGYRERERDRMAAAALLRCGLSAARAGSLIALLEGHGPAALDWLAEAEQEHEHARREGLAKEAAQQRVAEAALADDFEDEPGYIATDPISVTAGSVVIEDESYDPTGWVDQRGAG
jgi:hypothetical protein